MQRVYVAGVAAAQLRFEETNIYICHIEHFAYGKINEWIFSNPRPWNLVLLGHMQQTCCWLCRITDFYGGLSLTTFTISASRQNEIEQKNTNDRRIPQTV